MKSKIAQTIITGLIVTAVMTIVGLMAPYMGLPKMNTAEMFSAMMGGFATCEFFDSLHDRDNFCCGVCVSV